MLRRPKEPSRGPNNHIRLYDTAHRTLKIRAAHDGTTIQHLVAALIRRTVGEPESRRDEP